MNHLLRKSALAGLLGLAAASCQQAPTSQAPNASAEAPAPGKSPAQEPAAPASAATPAAAAASGKAGSSGVNATAPAAPNSPQRAAIMDSLRPAIERELDGPVEFVVNRAEVRDGWALVIADPQRPGGGRIDARQHFPSEVASTMDGVTVHAFLRFSGGRWTLVDHAIGPTDVWSCGFEGAPRSLTGC